MAKTATPSTDTVVDLFKQWILAGPTKTGPVMTKPHFEGPSDRNYNLKNKRVRKFLQHEHQDVGINLGWTDDAEPATAKKVARWFFARDGRDDRPVTYGETIALGLGQKPSFIRYAERDVGINLDWSDSPVFEWKLLGGKIGETVRAGQWLAIYNEKCDECLVQFDRTAGGDIGWPSSKTWDEQIGDVLAEAVRNHARKAYKKLLGRD
jgi:hypothetical protein